MELILGLVLVFFFATLWMIADTCRRPVR